MPEIALKPKKVQKTQKRQNGNYNFSLCNILTKFCTWKVPFK